MQSIRISRSGACVTAIVIAAASMVPMLGAAAAQAPVGLGTASAFAVLAGSGITNTGPTTITGDVGTFPTPSVTGFGSVTLHGTNHAGDAVTQQAKTDLTAAYNTAAGSTPTTAVPTELGGRTLTPGVYGGPTLGITGTLTLDTLGDPNAVFIFKAGSTLITATNSSVIVAGGATACNVYWQVGSSATLGTGSRLVGTILAATSITATTGATVQGRVLAQDGAVTLDTNTITRPTCAPPAATTTTAGPTTTTTTSPAGVGIPGAPAATAPGVGAATPSGGAPVGPTGVPGGPGGPGLTPGGDTNSGFPPSPPSTGRPGLPVTGWDTGMALLGAGGVALGLTLVMGGRARRRSVA